MRTAALVAGAVLVAGLAGCGSGTDAGDDTRVPLSMKVTVEGLTPGGTIPVEMTCQAGGRRPTVRWTGVPRDARQVAVVVDDPDAPRGTFVHWIVTGLTPVDGAIDSGAQLPSSVQPKEWTPPCPPKGDRPHHYRFSVYALEAPPKTDSPAAIRKVAVAGGRLTATFARSEAGT